MGRIEIKGVVRSSDLVRRLGAHLVDGVDGALHGLVELEAARRREAAVRVALDAVDKLGPRATHLVDVAHRVREHQFRVADQRVGHRDARLVLLRVARPRPKRAAAHPQNTCGHKHTELG